MLSPRQIIAPIFVALLAPILFAQSIAVGPITVDATSPYFDPAPCTLHTVRVYCGCAGLTPNIPCVIITRSNSPNMETRTLAILSL